jgi:hypothetical protein
MVGKILTERRNSHPETIRAKAQMRASDNVVSSNSFLFL